MNKLCKTCHTYKPIAEFDFRIDRKSHRSFCKECRRSSQNSRNLTLNPNSSGKKRSKIDARNFKKIHGISYNTHLKRLNVQHRLRQALRKRINIVLKQTSIRLRTEEMLGCSLVKLKIHLQMMFHRDSRGRHEYMTWENYGKWEIDHIVPLSSFDLTDPSQQRAANHYTNLQPLWKTDNRRKSDSMSK